MKNEALIKDYLEEKDKLINNLVKDLKEHFSIYTEKDFIRTVLKYYDIVYHLCLSTYIEYDENNEIFKIKYGYYVTINSIKVILEEPEPIEKDLEIIAREVIEASIKDLDKRI